MDLFGDGCDEYFNTWYAHPDQFFHLAAKRDEAWMTFRAGWDAAQHDAGKRLDSMVEGLSPMAQSEIIAYGLKKR